MQLRESDIRAMVRLLGEVSAFETGPNEKKRFLLSGLCRLIDADHWSWTLRRSDDGGSSLCLQAMSGETETPTSMMLSNSDWKPAQGSRLMLTVQQISDDVISSISLTRKKGRIAFAAREVKIAQIILSEIPWLHEPSHEIDTPPPRQRLSPRERATLVYLINGLNRKAIADRLHISPHTVHGYIKAIYQHHQVNSRAELMKQFTLGWQKKSNR